MSMTTTAASVAPLATAPAVPPMALYAAAAPATPELVGSGIDFSKRNATVSELRMAGYELFGLGRNDWYWKRLRFDLLWRYWLVRQTEDIFSVRAEFTLNMNSDQACQELYPRSKDRQSI